MVCEPAQVVDHEHLLELPEQRHDGQEQRVVLGVAGEVLGDHQRAGHVPGDDRLAEFEVVEILRNADVGLDVGVGDALRALGQRDGEFPDFVGDLCDVGSQMVGQHRKRLGVDRESFLPDELL